jgi:hypothetical protein
MKTSAKQASSGHTVLGWFSHQQSQGEPGRERAPETEASLPTPARTDQGQHKPQEPEVGARGVIKREEVRLLARYGTSYGLLDESIADYGCVLKSDAHRLGEYVGDSVSVSGPLIDVIGGMPVMEVTHLQLLKMKWMR